MGEVMHRAEQHEEDERRLFYGVHAWIVGVDSDEYIRLSLLLYNNRGIAYKRLNAKCTHCIIPSNEGECISLAYKHGLTIVTPDWILDSVSVRFLPATYIYHPNLLLCRKPSYLVQEKKRLIRHAISARNNIVCRCVYCVPVSTPTSIDSDNEEVPAPSGSISSKTPACEQLEQPMPVKQQVSVTVPSGPVAAPHDHLPSEPLPPIQPQHPTSEIKRRNQDLIVMLGKEQQRSEQFQLELKECQSHASQLEMDLKQQTELQACQQQEISALKQQLQVQLQAVCMLKQEKNELAETLIQSQRMTKQKAVEVEELQVYNKALENHIHDLQEEISVSVNQNHYLESAVQDQSKEINQLKVENRMLTKQLGEVKEKMVEFKQNFHVKSDEVKKLQQLLQEKQSHLELAQLRVKCQRQLSSSGRPDIEKQLDVPQQPQPEPQFQVMLQVQQQMYQQQQLILLFLHHTSISVSNACNLVHSISVYDAKKTVQCVFIPSPVKKCTIVPMQNDIWIFSEAKQSVLTTNRIRQFPRNKGRFRNNEQGPSTPLRAFPRFLSIVGKAFPLRGESCGG